MPSAAAGSAPATSAPLGHAWNRHSSQQDRATTVMACKRWPAHRGIYAVGLSTIFTLLSLSSIGMTASWHRLVHQSAQAGSFSGFGFLPLLPFCHIICTTFSVSICFTWSIVAFLQQKGDKGDASVLLCNCGEVSLLEHCNSPQRLSPGCKESRTYAFYSTTIVLSPNHCVLNCFHYYNLIS